MRSTGAGPGIRRGLGALGFCVLASRHPYGVWRQDASGNTIAHAVTSSPSVRPPAWTDYAGLFFSVSQDREHPMDRYLFHRKDRFGYPVSSTRSRWVMAALLIPAVGYVYLGLTWVS